MKTVVKTQDYMEMFYDFSVDYSAITNDKIVDIHNYLMENNNII